MTAPSTCHSDQVSLDFKSSNFSQTSGNGHLIPLRTKAEVHSKLTLIEIYVVEIPIKAASKIVKCVTFSQQDTINLQHLRRFAKPEHLPVHVREGYNHPIDDEGIVDETLVVEPNTTNSALDKSYDNDGESQVGSIQFAQQTLFFLICTTSQVSYQQIFNTISSSIRVNSSDKQLHIRTIQVPAQPPTSQDQAQEWSLQYWPTVYKKHNPNGAHPSIISRAEDEIRPWVGKWMALAKQVSYESCVGSIGESIGTVVIDPTTIGSPSVVAVAGDARWKGYNCSTRQGVITGSGNVMAHSVMRAIGLVARKRLALLNNQDLLQKVEPIHAHQISQDHPLSLSEVSILSQDNLKPGGYLCTELEIYTTHEPCVMCSMAILHSRFGKVVFRDRMPRTGGLTADIGKGGGKNVEEGGLGYGLFWLHELNWKLLAWQWIEGGGLGEEDGSTGIKVSATIHA
ncbi:tRNA-specific adenosine deaminase subunit tad3 [Varicellaria rhodocarpa]|nr:tRNA-specific adenosine deaminase subunit tad3 [Varicellaria rhodocarpa]